MIPPTSDPIEHARRLKALNEYVYHIEMEAPEYREKLLSHAVKRGFGDPRLDGNDWIFETEAGARAVVQHEPSVSEKKGYLIWAKIQLTAAANAANPNPRPKRVRRPPQLPTRVRDEGWLHAFAPDAPEDPPATESGKWMMFVGHQYADDTWINVSRAIHDGRLSFYGKISTVGSTPPGRPHVLCVYIADYRDREAAMLLRERLREMGFKRKIYFKRDSMTAAGLSGSEFGA